MDLRLAASWAAVIVSIISVIINVWWPWHNRPQAGLQLTELHPFDKLRKQSPFYALLAETEPSRVLRVSNSGDGDAYSVTFEGRGCKVEACFINDNGTEAKVITPSVIPKLRTKDQIYLRVWDSPSDEFETIIVHWTLQPTWRDQRVHQTVAIRGKLENQPLRPIPDHRDPHPPLWWFRLTHFVRRHLARFSHTRSQQTDNYHDHNSKG